jgi:hypothetical protein
VPAVVLGGAGTLAVVAIWSYLFPELRKLENLTDAEPPPMTPEADQAAP